MKNRTLRQMVFLVAALMLGMQAPPANGQVRFYTSLASFQANSATGIAATFEGFAPTNTNIFIPPNPPIMLGGVTFTPFDTSSSVPPNLYVATTDTLAPFSVQPTSNVLEQTTLGLGIGFGQRTVQIPVATPVTLSNKRLKLTMFSAASLHLNLQMGSSTYLRASNFVGTP